MAQPVACAISILKTLSHKSYKERMRVTLMNIMLREYQLDTKITVESIKESTKILICMATGLGKTATFASIERKGRVLILSHRKELVMNPVKYYDVPVGIIQGKRCDTEQEVISASVQTLKNKLFLFNKNDFDMIIIDEAHHSASPSYQKILNYFKPRLVLGFTATPYRLDGKELDFDIIIDKYDIKYGIMNNYLADIYCREINVGYDLSKVRKTAGDLNKKDLDRAVACTADAVAQVYKNNCTDKNHTIIFAVSVEHANVIASHIENAYVITGKTKMKERDEILEKFNKKEINCLVTCEVLTEGVDLPYTDTIILARPTMSKGLYYQMVGRGLRNPDGNKKLKLIDCVGNTGRHDICSITDVMNIELDERKKRNARKILADGADASSLETKILKLSEKEDINITVKARKERRLLNINSIKAEDIIRHGIYAHEITENNIVVVNINNHIVRIDSKDDITALITYFETNGINAYQKASYKETAKYKQPSEKQIGLIKFLAKKARKPIPCVNNMDEANRAIAELKFRYEGAINIKELSMEVL